MALVRDRESQHGQLARLQSREYFRGGRDVGRVRGSGRADAGALGQEAAMNNALPWHSARALRLTGPWLWSPGIDLAVFGGSALFAFALLAVGEARGWTEGDLPE